MSNINKSIAKCLIYAQIASDGGKRIFRLQTKDEDMSRYIYCGVSHKRRLYQKGGRFNTFNKNKLPLLGRKSP